MDEKLEKQIFDKYPALYRQKDLNMRETCMVWGISTGDGWYKIIEDMSAKITKHAKDNNLVIEAAQVKEKFGLLRVYLETYDDVTEKIIAEAEEASAKTCEECGDTSEKVTTSGRGWIQTLCAKCRAKPRH